MPEEWVKWIEENMPSELLEEWRSSRSWAVQWRDKRCAELEADLSRYKRWSQALFHRQLYMVRKDCGEVIEHEEYLEWTEKAEAALAELNEAAALGKEASDGREDS